MIIFTYITIFLLGAIIGSFLNCLIFRLHSGETMLGRSHCMFCKKQISWYDNVPVLSFIVLLGKCRHCKKGISVQYPIVEFVVGILFLLAFYLRFPVNTLDPSGLLLAINNFEFLYVLRDWFVISVMTIVFIYDLRWYMILDKVMFPAMAVVALFNIVLAYFDPEPLKYLSFSLISGIIGGAFFLFQFVVSKGKWIGGGDVRLGFLMGLILGWPGIILALMLAYISGAIVGIFLIVNGKKKLSSKLPFGVFLSVACVISLFWTAEIIDWYFQLL